MIIQCEEKEKRDRIVSRTDRNMFVEAGAGAGKTTLIKDRIINQLKSGMRPDEIAVITFTNAATQELRSRIIDAALEEERKTDLPEKQAKNLRFAVENIDQMQISTIHSFCSRILRERSLEVGIPMDLDLIKNGDYERLKKESFVRWAEGLEESDWDLLLSKDMDRKKAVDALKDLTDRLIGIDDEQIGRIKMGQPPIETEQWNKEASDFVQEFIKEILRRAGEAYESQYTSLDQIEKDRWLKNGNDILEAIGKNDNESIVKIAIEIGKDDKILRHPAQKYFKDLAKAQEKKIKDSASDAKEEKNKPSPADKVKNAENILKGINDFLDRKRDDLKKLIGRKEDHFYSNYIEYAKKARAYFYNYIGPEVLTNDTLIRNTKKLLEQSKGSQRYFSGKFKCIYVDEYQDTDHVQDTFIRLLAEDPDQQGVLRDGALFIVGDPKQSIYRFRGAEPEVYFKTKRYFEDLENADVMELQDNYRSNSSIVDWVNTQFQNKAITPGQAYVPMKANKFVPSELVDDQTLDGIYYQNSIIVRQQGSEVNQDMKSTAKLIWNLVNNEYYLIEDGKKRRIRYSDILLLCMWTVNIPLYIKEFRQYGIPVSLDMKFTVNTEWYMKAFCRIYQYLTCRYDKRNSVAARESLVALGMESEQAKQTLSELAGKTRDLSPVGLLYFLEANWKLLIPRDSGCDEGIRRKIQARITQMIGNIVSSTNGSSHEIKKALSEYLDDSIEHELALEEDVDAVRFMNLHKAKGLERNIVIWANRVETMNFKRGVHRSSDAYYPVVRVGQNIVWCAYDHVKGVEKEAEESDRAETIRLEYVAVTRAKCACIFMDTYDFKKKDDSVKKKVLFGEGYTTENAKSIKDVIERKDIQIKTPPASPPEKSRVVSARCAREDLRGALYESVSPSDLEKSAGGKKKEGWTAGQHSRPVGAVFGTTMHRAFELLIGRCLHTGRDASPCNDKEQALVRSCYVQAIQENISDIPAEQAADYEEALSGMIKALSGWWRQLQAGGQLEECYQELPFSYFDKTDDKTVWNHGFADLVLKMTNGEYLIIDYKSDSDEGHVSEESFVSGLRKKYGPQIEAYKDAVETLFRVPREKIKARLIWFTQKEDNTYQCKETEIQTEIQTEISP